MYDCDNNFQEVEMFLMDALWVNERLRDYSGTLDEISGNLGNMGISQEPELEMILSEDEGDQVPSTSSQYYTCNQVLVLLK